VSLQDEMDVVVLSVGALLEHQQFWSWTTANA
jgi:hypothetical protein